MGVLTRWGRGGGSWSRDLDPRTGSLVSLHLMYAYRIALSELQRETCLAAARKSAIYHCVCRCSIVAVSIASAEAVPFALFYAKRRLKWHAKNSQRLSVSQSVSQKAKAKCCITVKFPLGFYSFTSFFLSVFITFVVF